MTIESIAFWEYIVSFALIIFMKIVCFVLGYLTIRLGYQLISSGVKGEFKFSANLGGAKADLASVSPGLLFVLLGVSLIGYAIYVPKGAKMEFKPAKQIEKPEPLIPSESDYLNTLKDIKKEGEANEGE